MKTKLVIAAILVQFLVLAWMGGQREWIVRTGPTVWLRTAPVDPRDLFRGDYVTLGYEISTIPAEKFGPKLKQKLAADQKRYETANYWRGREIVLYVALKVNPNSGVAEVATADMVPPAAGAFIKGRVRPYWNGVHGSLTGVAYGIDAYFVQQGKGRELERRAPEGMPEGVQVPMEMQVALGRGGTAVLKGHRWNGLGVSVEIRKDRRAPEQQPPADPAKPATTTEPKITMAFHNASPAPLAVVLPRDLRTLRMESQENWNSPNKAVTAPRTGLPSLTDADVRVLKPGEKTTVEIDPARPEWLVKLSNNGTPLPLGHKDLGYQNFRLVYEAPAADACKGLKDAALIWHGELAGRQFGTYEFRNEE